MSYLPPQSFYDHYVWNKTFLIILTHIYINIIIVYSVNQSLLLVYIVYV